MLSRVWSERHESRKEQNKAFKLLSFSYKKKQNSSKNKRKNETEQNSLKKTKKQRRRRKKGLRPVKKKTKKQRRRRRRTVSYGPIRPREVFEFRPESAVSPDTAQAYAESALVEEKKRTRHRRAGILVSPRPCILVSHFHFNIS